MPWKEFSALEERTRLVLMMKDGQQSVAHLSRQFGISRQTAYKWWQRYARDGLAELRTRSSRPHCSPPRMTSQWQERLRVLRKRRPSWGARKLYAGLSTQFGRRRTPAVSTLSFWLRRLDLIASRRVRAKRGPVLEPFTLSVPQAINEVWTVDFKGWMRMSDGVRCEPLTVRDLFSRYVLCITLLFNQSDTAVRTAMSRVFTRYGLPKIIRVDNGAPFGGNGALGLSRLSLWWVRLGIKVEFIGPACPQDNGAHEQMHRQLKADTMRVPAATPRGQQARWHWWRRYYNQQRPHEALGQKTPARFYRPSPRHFEPDLPALIYPSTWKVRRVCGTGSIRWQGRLRFVGRAFFDQSSGLSALEPGVVALYLGSQLIGTLHANDHGGIRPATRPRSRPHKSVSDVLRTKCQQRP